MYNCKKETYYIYYLIIYGCNNTINEVWKKGLPDIQSCRT